ncbi:MAG: tetratricopeptide repeat protein [Planctomycetes bacterium]|nr:tetratricopeptide repeat protein [Planctomycetota bacterium]
MKSSTRSLLVSATMIVATACSTSTGASQPHLDHVDGAGAPTFQPLMVVPLPALQTQATASGRPMDALQARATPLGDVLLALFKDSDINLVIDPAVQATECTFDIKKSSVEETFEALLQSLDLGYQWDGSFLRVQPNVDATIAVDLLSGGGGGGGGGGGSGGESSSSGDAGNGGSSGGGGDFWQALQQSLPEVIGDGSAIVNQAANTIHVRARPSAVRRLQQMIGTTLRRANKQVSLEARVLEVRLENEHSLGVNWALLPGLFNTSKTGLAPGGSVVSQTAASGGTAVTFGILKGGDFSVLVDALESQGQVRVLSSPRVSTLNNQTATINVTDQVPYITREVITEEGTSRTEFSVEFAQTGVVLSVRPLIGEDGLLSVSVTPTVREQIGTAVTPDGLVSVPVISERQATTTVRVADGQAIALGGLRSTRKSESRSGIPFLMDVPWLGQAFSNTVQQRDEVELMIVLVPRVMDDTWISEEIQRGAHRLVQLRRGFQWNSIRLEGQRPEDWSSGSLQGQAQAAVDPGVRLPERAPVATKPDQGTTVTRKGLASHFLGHAEAALRGGDPAAALEHLERALELEPTSTTALVVAGVLHERRGDRKRARVLLDRALELAPEDVAALTARGQLELVGGSAWSAKGWLQRAHEIGNTTLTAANLGAAMLALGEDGPAREFLRKAADAGAPPELHANLAYAEMVNGHLDKARDSLHRALVAGADARNPRIVALERLIADAEAKAKAEVDAGR